MLIIFPWFEFSTMQIWVLDFVRTFISSLSSHFVFTVMKNAEFKSNNKVQDVTGQTLLHNLGDVQMLGPGLECQTHHVLLLLCISGLEYSTGIISFKPFFMLCRLLSVTSSCWSLWRTMCGCVLLWSLVQALDILSLAGWLIKWWIFMNTATDYQ